MSDDLRLPARRTGGESRPATPTYLGEAFLNPINLAALSAALGASILLVNPIPIAVAAGAELLYLGTVPGTRRFREMVDRRNLRRRRMQHYKADAALYGSLSPEQQKVVDGLKKIRDEIHSNYGRLGGGSQLLIGPSLARVDSLISSFLRLMDQLNAYRQYLGAANKAQIDREIGELGTEIDQDEPGRLRDIKERRLGILEQRRARFGRAEENREVISHQLAAIEDILRLIHEQSLTARDPQDISRLLDTLAVEVEEMQGTIHEMESFLQIQAEVEEELAPRPPSGGGR